MGRSCYFHGQFDWTVGQLGWAVNSNLSGNLGNFNWYDRLTRSWIVLIIEKEIFLHINSFMLAILCRGVTDSFEGRRRSGICAASLRIRPGMGIIMKKTEKGGSSRRSSIKWHILAISTLPLLFACVVIIIFASWTMERGFTDQVFEGLQGAATGILLTLDNVSGESFQVQDGDLYKGTYNVSQNMDGIDYYAESNDVVITLFYGDIGEATTIKDENGERLIDTKASSDVVSEVQGKGDVYTSHDIEINGVYYFGYYMPVRDTEQNIIGMVFAGRDRSKAFRYILVRTIFIILIAVLNYIGCVIVSVTVTNKRFLRPLRKLTAAARELARGNIDLEIQKESDDEFGDLAESFMLLVDNTKKQAHVAEKMAEGDLTVAYQPVSEVDVMGHAITSMIHDNNQNLSAINLVSERMAEGAKEIADASQSLANGTMEQASAVEGITASIKDIAGSAEVNAHNAGNANELAQKTREEAAYGNEQMQKMKMAMDEINASSQDISKIMKIIDDIASQTNIISLNASVEAVRAGVHGKGFAVVAEEIRSLAAKSTEAAKNSAEMIEDSIKKTAAGSKLAVETAAALETILSSVENMTSLISEIAEASVDQSDSVQVVDTGIVQIKDVLQTNSATSQQSAAASAELSNLAIELKKAVDKYKLRQ